MSLTALIWEYKWTLNRFHWAMCVCSSYKMAGVQVFQGPRYYYYYYFRNLIDLLTCDVRSSCLPTFAGAKHCRVDTNDLQLRYEAFLCTQIEVTSVSRIVLPLTCAEKDVISQNNWKYPVCVWVCVCQCMVSHLSGVRSPVLFMETWVEVAKRPLAWTRTGFLFLTHTFSHTNRLTFSKTMKTERKQQKVDLFVLICCWCFLLWLWPFLEFVVIALFSDFLQHCLRLSSHLLLLDAIYFIIRFLCE